MDSMLNFGVSAGAGSQRCSIRTWNAVRPPYLWLSCRGRGFYRSLRGCWRLDLTCCAVRSNHPRQITSNLNLRVALIHEVRCQEDTGHVHEFKIKIRALDEPVDHGWANLHR